jgi:hypothetical protein
MTSHLMALAVPDGMSLLRVRVTVEPAGDDPSGVVIGLTRLRR